MTLIVSQLMFERNFHPLFEALNRTVRAGECLQIRGANGCGKSTLLRILAGLIEPHAGTITWQGHSIFEQRDIYQQQLHFLGHQNGIKRHLTVYENLIFSSALMGQKPSLQHIKNVLLRMGLQHLQETKAFTLSAGQARRLSLAKLLLNPLPLWILDEPMTALDVAGQQLFTDILNQHILEGGTAIITTHHPLLNEKNEVNILHLSPQTLPHAQGKICTSLI